MLWFDCYVDKEFVFLFVEYQCVLISKRAKHRYSRRKQEWDSLVVGIAICILFVLGIT